jgi:hypothetical protein
VSESYQQRLDGYFKKGVRKLERFESVKVVNGEYKAVDNVAKNKDNAFNSLDFIVNNSNYQPEYLKKVFVVEFFKILRSVEKKLKNVTK